jgi:hypothetical protein
VKTAIIINTTVEGTLKIPKTFNKLNISVKTALKIILRRIRLINPKLSLTGYKTEAKAYPGKTNNSKKLGITLKGNSFRGEMKRETNEINASIITKKRSTL